MQREARSLLGQETVAIVERESYQAPSGRTVVIAGAIRDCLARTRYFGPLELDRLQRDGVSRFAEGPPATIETTDESTLAAIARAVGQGAGSVSALNFASARNPGGGFLKGAHAQEESQAHSSALYASLLTAGEFYERHRRSASLLYSDAMIISAACPVFRDDAGTLLEAAHVVTFLTSPAPNAGAIIDQKLDVRNQITATLNRRAELILALAADAKQRTVVLGA